MCREQQVGVVFVHATCLIPSFSPRALRYPEMAFTWIMCSTTHIAMLSVHPLRQKEGGMEEEACFLSETLKVQEEEAHAVEASCGRDVAASICEVWHCFPGKEMNAMTSAALQRCSLCLVFSWYGGCISSVVLTAAGIICSSSLSDGSARCCLVHLTTFPSEVQNCGPWQLLEQVWEWIPSLYNRKVALLLGSISW